MISVHGGRINTLRTLQKPIDMLQVCLLDLHVSGHQQYPRDLQYVLLQTKLKNSQQLQ